MDNPTVLTELTEKSDKGQVAVVISETGSLEKLWAAGYYSIAPQWNNETSPSCSGPAATSTCADASLEKILHTITEVGFANAFPSTFDVSWWSNSLLTQAMDVARGGRFQDIPSSYPDNATFVYNDKTCSYRCQATEYIYFGLAAYVGALEGRGVSQDTENPAGIAGEFKLYTRELLKKDTKLTAIIEVSIYFIFYNERTLLTAFFRTEQPTIYPTFLQMEPITVLLPVGGMLCLLKTLLPI